MKLSKIIDAMLEAAKDLRLDAVTIKEIEPEIEQDILQATCIRILLNKMIIF